jgi:hypothetical protein
MIDDINHLPRCRQSSLAYESGHSSKPGPNILDSIDDVRHLSQTQLRLSSKSIEAFSRGLEVAQAMALIHPGESRQAKGLRPGEPAEFQAN